MFRTGCCVRNDRTANELIAPRGTEFGLVGPQERIGVQERAVACRGVHGDMLPRSRTFATVGAGAWPVRSGHAPVVHSAAGRN